jgi:hypothetical protein
MPLLSACVAMAALPLLAGGAMVAGGHATIRAATPRPKPGAALAAPARPREMTAGSGVVLTDLTELPPPDSPGSGADPWQPFLAYALAAAQSGEGAGRRRSALIEDATALGMAKTRECKAKTPAVIVDLDPDTRPFIPTAAAAAAPPRALVDGLAKLRAAGVVVAWISALPGQYVTQVGEVLRSSGLDPAAEDPLLLARSADDRKQLLREEAMADVCVIAVAGDRKADFDELFDYLRDPDSAAGLDSLLGAGWFIVPPPLG